MVALITVMPCTWRCLIFSCGIITILLIFYSTYTSSPNNNRSADNAVVSDLKLEQPQVTFEQHEPERESQAFPPVPPLANLVESATRTFTVQGNHFMKDGQRFSFRGGTAHYWRRPPEYWEDTMLKIKGLGLNAVQTYISWNLHEPEPQQYDFEKALDIRRYFQLAQKHGLLVIVRPGPFINAEVDMGGLPYWLLRLDRKMRLRTSDPSYFQHVDRWYRKLLPMLKSFMYVPYGGPIVMVQVENEYGSYYACDMKYRTDLRDLTRELVGPDVLLYTTDGPHKQRIECGRIEGTVTTVDFGAGADTVKALAMFRESVPIGPFMNSEFYPGWINHWSRKWNEVPFKKVLKTTEELLEMNASFTLYPIVGGTNFGFSIGSNIYGETFFPGCTSYDFDAPISESGDLSVKYMQLRQLFKKYNFVPPDPLPATREKKAYGNIFMTFSGTVFRNLKNLCPTGPLKSDSPLTFEVLEHPYGFVIYRTTLFKNYRDPARLIVEGLHDRAVVFVNKKRQGILSRTSGLTEVNIFARPGDVLDLLVQSEGRVTVGSFMNDSKGILGDVRLQNETLSPWEMYRLKLPGFPVKNPAPLNVGFDSSIPNRFDYGLPAFYTGKFKTGGSARSTFLKLNNFQQGYAFINGYNLGRYWPVVGPQITLYVPSAFLKEDEENILQLFEVDGCLCSTEKDCYVELVADPVIGDSVERIHRV